MNCERYADAIGDLVDGRIDDDARLELEAHLSGCAPCQALVSELRAIREAASALPVHRPPERVWAAIESQLPGITLTDTHAKAEEVPPKPQPAGTAEGRSPSSWIAKVFSAPGWRLAWGGAATLALAAILLFVLLPYLRPSPHGQLAARPAAPGSPSAPGVGTPVNASPDQLVETVESELKMAEQHYEKAIAGLEQIAKAGEGTLDPQVAGTLRKNLGVIDQAIHDSRVALQAQPTNELAQESLFEAFRRKVGLLQDTVTLINEMRKGNQAGAAKIIGNMQKS